MRRNILGDTPGALKHVDLFINAMANACYEALGV